MPRAQLPASPPLCLLAFVLAGDPVWVKVVSKTGQRLGLAMRDVDQVTGVDQLPMQRGGPGGADGRSNPSGPTGANSQSALHGLSGIKVGVWAGWLLRLH